MGFLIVPLVVTFFVVPTNGTRNAETLADFTRLRSAIGAELYVADVQGVERRLTLISADTQSALFSAGGPPFALARADIMRVERTRDRSWDGAVKGAAFGVLVGLLLAPHHSSDKASIYLGAMGSYAALGYLFDLAAVHRQEVYRAPALSPRAGFTIRF